MCAEHAQYIICMYTVQMYCMCVTLWTDLLYVHSVCMYIHTYVRICSNPSITPSSCAHTPPSHLRLEGAVELCNEGALSPQSQDPSLHEGCLNVVILNHNILLQHFHGKVLLCILQLSQQDLEEQSQHSGRVLPII